MAKQARLYQLEGIILGRRDHGEADRVIICLTSEGRTDLLAKGARKPQSRKAGHLEQFARTKMLVSRVSGSWDIVSQAEAVELRPILQEDFQRGTYARYAVELVVRFFEREADEQLYELLDLTLGKLEVDESAELLVRWYEQRLLVLAGFRPQWHSCVGDSSGDLCDAELSPRSSDRRSYGLDPERGGALCVACYAALHQEPGVRLLSPSALSWLQALQRREYEELKEFTLPDRTAQELAHAMQHYIAHHLEYRPASLRIASRGDLSGRRDT
ncbi:MAG: DNA repair protein RecO [Anaerolineae bacterium]|nr:DNA repair protein RecO [Anaerolineae bacterium]